MLQPVRIKQTHFGHIVGFSWMSLLAGIILVGLILGAWRQRPAPELPSANLLDQLPLAFTPNGGQQATAVRFTAVSQSGALFFTDDGVQMALPEGTLELEIVGRGMATAVSGANQLPGIANYYLGSDAAKWQTGLPTYAAIRYQNIYPGIDLVYDGSEGLLKGTYYVAPGANPAQIGWRYEGETAVSLDPTTGDLRIALNEATDVIEKAPVAYQIVNGTRRSVPVHYRFDGDKIGFALDAYDVTRPLVLDPTLVYSSYLGGNSADKAKDVGVDSSGNIYVTGYTYSTSFPGGGSGNAGYDDVFVTKINAAGTAVIYTTIIGGNGTDEPGGIAVNSSGSKIWVVGQTTSNNWPTANAFQSVTGGGVDAFFLQLGSSGSLAFSSYYGGYLYDAAEDVALDSYGDVHITGSLWGGFFAKVSGQTYDLVYSRMISGQNAAGYGITLDSQNNIYITGEISSPDWPTVNPVQTNCGSYDDWTCSDDAFVVKLTPAGDDLLFSTYLGGSAANGGSGKDIGHAIAVDADGNIAVTGETFANDFPVVNAVQPQKQGTATMSDAFVIRLVRQGNGYQIGFSTYLGGDSTETGYAVSMNTAGQVFAAGLTNSSNYPVAAALQTQLGPGVCFSSSSRNCYDAFIAQFDSQGALPFSTYWGSTDDDTARGIALTGSGALYVVGSTDSGAFPTIDGGFQPNRGQSGEAFVMKLYTGQTPPPNFPNKVYLPAVMQ